MQLWVTVFARVGYSGGGGGVAREGEEKTFSHPWETCRMTSLDEFVQAQSPPPTLAYRSAKPFID